MIEEYIADLSLGEKRTLKEALQNGFPKGKVDLNAMGFTYDEERGVVVVEGLIEGDAIDGLEYLLPEFTALANDVLADVVLYASEDEQVDALRTYLSYLSKPDRQTLLRQLPNIKNGRDINLHNLVLFYDDERNSVVVEVREEGRKVDALEVGLERFLEVVG